MAETDILKTTLQVQYKNDNFIFRIPGIMEEAKIAQRMRILLQRATPGDSGSIDGLDDMTTSLIRAASIFETLLAGSSATWPYSAGTDGKPVVDSSKFPTNKVYDVLLVAKEFNVQLDNFRGDGAGDNQAVSQDVAGQQGAGDQSVQSGDQPTQ